MKGLKKFLSIITAMGLALSIAACGGSGAGNTGGNGTNTGNGNNTGNGSGNTGGSGDDSNVKVECQYDWGKDDDMLSILCIGNSFSDDTMEYVWNIANSLNLGVEKISLGNLYIGGCRLDMHYANALADAPAYEYRTNSAGQWRTTNHYKISTAIKSQHWDFISIQQASGQSGQESTFWPIEELVEYVKSLASTDTKIVWNMTWAYQQDSTHGDFKNYNNNQTTMYSKIVETVQNTVAKNNDISIISPTGTAIQNARTSFLGDTLTRDGYHLSLDLGRYIAGLAFFHALTGVELTEDVYSPMITDEQFLVAIESAKNAVKYPYSVTNSTYVEK